MKTRTPHLWNLPPLLTLLLLALIAGTTFAESVVDTVHNLGAGGPGQVKASSEREVCIFCHAPHHNTDETPLWNHSLSTQTYVPYSSPTMDATVDQPTGASKLCLSCHDGTVALGMVNSRSTPIDMDGNNFMQGTANVGTNLSQQHPVSFTYDSALAAKDGKLRDPSLLTGRVKLDHANQVQCTSCHDPHNNQYGNFLVMENNAAQLCETCHTDASSPMAAHAISNAPLAPGSNPVVAMSSRAGKPAKILKNQPKTVAQNSCNNCHASHGAKGDNDLLRTKREEQTCFKCHNGTVDQKNLQAEFTKPSVHPVLQTSDLHRANEDITTAPEHVACSDCHNPHEARTGEGKGHKTRAAGPIVEVKGVARSGGAVDSISKEYELCFRCHGDNAGGQRATVNRISQTLNTRQEFSSSSRSFHPVVESGRNPNVPSLVSPWNVASRMNCTDCHNNDQGSGAGGNGPNGPHGSIYEPILERRLVTTDQVGESPENYALCYKCHSRESILSDQSFAARNKEGKDRGHRFHVVDERTACTTCHDSHASTKNEHLINFNPDYVRDSGGKILYQSRGLFRGSCTLTCHGYTHDEAAYPDAADSAKRMRRKK